MRLESIPPTTDNERLIRRQAHVNAILKGLTMRQAVFEALEFWNDYQNKESTQNRHSQK